MSLDRTEYNYSPIIKHKGFNPSPVAGNIPFYADSVSNPKCVGTAAWEDFWLEQLYYCIYGYDTGGLWIPPTYYFYLNFNIIKGLYGSIYPHFLDIHYKLFSLIDEIKKDDNLTGIIIPKARRKGLSLVGNVVGNHGFRFIEDYRMGVAGGLERFVEGFRIKLYASLNNVPPEFKINILRKNDNQLSNGYMEKNENNQYEERVMSISMFATMRDDFSKFEGEFFQDVIMEESGQFELLDKSYESIRPALELGEKTLGTFYFYGTGGNMLKGSRAFKDLWHNAESYGLLKFFINGARYYFPYYRGAIDREGNNVAKTPNLDELYPDLAPEQLIGCEDVIASTESIRTERMLRAKNPNKKALAEWNQKYPLTVQEVFTSSGFNNFNSDLLYEQQYYLDSNEVKYTEWVLDFVKDKDGQYVTPLEVEARPAGKKDKDWEKIDIYLHPNPKYRNLDIGGTDGYNEDQSQTSRSLGGIVVVRRYDEFNYPDKEHNEKTVVCHYLKRPPRKEQHWEISLKISIYYGLVKNMMISAESDMVINYFKENGGRKYLSPRPKAFDAPDSKQMHDYGAKMNTFSKPRMISLLQTFVEDCIKYVFFPELIQNFLAYDYENIGTDWDDVDALGMALMRCVDIKRAPTEVHGYKSEAMQLDLPEYERGKDGVLYEINDFEDEIIDRLSQELDL